MTNSYPQQKTAARHALIVTLDHVDDGYYLGWKGELPQVAGDRERVHSLLTAAGFWCQALSNEEATRDAVRNAILAANHLQAGDLFVIYVSSHGAELPNLNGDEEEDDADQVWCLYDGMFVDDEMAESLLTFQPGVQIVVILDACHSGSAITNELTTAVRLRKGQLPELAELPDLPSKLAPAGVADYVYTAQKERYDAILTRPAVSLDDAGASIVLLAACQDKGMAYLVEDGSLFFLFIASVWQCGSFKGTYQELMDAARKLVSRVSDDQNPKASAYGNQDDPLLNKPAFRQ